ncbi:MAG: DUF1294 domain-containing protein [Lachnospiraceae bacterium]|nr:DUF1294 domain-containing protein [Lachnospiraceae bacterium]
MDVIKTIIIYLAAMNLAGFASMGIDKWKAAHRSWRIPEHTLFFIATLGGSFGSLVGMHLFRHKTKHKSFLFGLPLIFAVHVIIAAYLIGSEQVVIM